MNVAFRQEANDRSSSTAPRGPAGPLARIRIFDDLADAAPTWERLQTAGAIQSPYQAYDWVHLWHSHVSPHEGVKPLVIAGFDTDDNPLFLWPLVLERMGKLNVAAFFGGKHATLNFPAWQAGYAQRLAAEDLNQILDSVGRAVPQLDLLMLASQPVSWNGLDNPFALLPHQRSAEDNFRLRLTVAGPEILVRELSSTFRGRLRNKERHLAKLPGYRYLRASTPADVDRCLDAFFAQKATKLAAMGLKDVFASPGVQDFIRAACHRGLAEGRPIIELHALEGDGELLALFSGVHDGQRLTSMFNSHTLSDHARFSPGLILLQYFIVDAAGRHFEMFDVGPGWARYKTFFCKEFEPIFDSILPISWRGRVAAPILRGLNFAKSEIKRNVFLWNLIAAIRRRGGAKSQD